MLLLGFSLGNVLVFPKNRVLAAAAAAGLQQQQQLEQTNEAYADDSSNRDKKKKKKRARELASLQCNPMGCVANSSGHAFLTKLTSSKEGFDGFTSFVDGITIWWQILT